MTTPPAGSASPSARPRRKAPLAFKLVALGIVAFFGFVVAEVGLRIAFPSMSVGPMQTRPDPYYGYWLRPNLDCRVKNSRGIRYHERTNSIGHRAPEYIDAPSGHVICLGDSYTMGETVDAGEEYAGLLREALRPEGFEVINFGRAGNGQGRWLKFLKRDAKDYHPRLVVMQLCYNDFGDNEVEGLFRIGADGALEELPVAGPRAIDRVRDMVEAIPGVPYLYTYQLLKQLARGSGGAQGFHPDQKQLTAEERSAQDALTFTLVRRCMELSRESGAGIVWTSVGLPDERIAQMRALGDEFGAIEIPVPYKDAQPDLYNSEDPHWNARGQRFVADEILRVIRDEQLLDANP